MQRISFFSQHLLAGAVFFLTFGFLSGLVDRAAAADALPYQVAAYYWPNFHVDPRNEEKLGPNWTEWDLMKRAVQRFSGESQPQTPLWGYSDETDPHDMARAIDAMADHGVTAVIFDWYRYDDGTFLEAALDRGFLQSPNRGRLKFALMWANHDYVDIFPASLHKYRELWHPGAVTRATFDKATDTIIHDYFSQPNYWKIDGAPYFSIYEMQTLVKALGGIEATRSALESFRARTKAAGFPDLHLNVTDWGIDRVSVDQAKEVQAGLLHMTDAPGKAQPSQAALAVQLLGVNSVTTYTWVHTQSVSPREPYADWAKGAEAYWPQAQAKYPVPYFPNVSVGWDPSPRTNPTQPWDPNEGYPYSNAVVDNTPIEFKRALLAARNYLDHEPRAQRILTVNSWNEWTEGSNLEPNQRWGLQYLEAVRDVFGAPGAPALP